MNATSSGAGGSASPCSHWHWCQPTAHSCPPSAAYGTQVAHGTPPAPPQPTGSVEALPLKHERGGGG